MIDIEKVPSQYRRAIRSLISFSEGDSSLQETADELKKACSLSPFKEQELIKTTVTYSILVGVLDLLCKKHRPDIGLEVGYKIEALERLLGQVIEVAP